MSKPVVIAADWSTSPKKRVAAEAIPTSSGYHIARLFQVADASVFLNEVSAHGESSSVVLGLDFPIGLPVFAAQRIGVTHFRSLLDGVRIGHWPEFFTPSDSPLHSRPFYPLGGPAGKSHESLISAFGASRIDDLKRRCELLSGASCMFWAVGPSQVAKACASGMTEVVLPLIARSHTRLWPFDGPMPALTASPGVTIAEIYPSALYDAVSVSRGMGKADRDKRRMACQGVIERLPSLNVTLAPDIETRMRDGFESDDDFDALISACALTSRELPDVPASVTPEVRRIEGWILGVS